MAVEYSCCETNFFIHIAIIVFLVCFAGLMSGLTLGLMSMSLVDLEVLAKSGTPTDRIHAGKKLKITYNLFLLCVCSLVLIECLSCLILDAINEAVVLLDMFVYIWILLYVYGLILFNAYLVGMSCCGPCGNCLFYLIEEVLV